MNHLTHKGGFDSNRSASNSSASAYVMHDDEHSQEELQQIQDFLTGLEGESSEVS